MVLVFHSLVGHAQVGVFTQHNDSFRDGVNASETVLTPANVNTTRFGMVAKVQLDDQIYAQLLVAPNVTAGGAKRNVLYAATTNNSLYALDASTGAQLWKVNLGTAFTVSNSGASCTDMLGSAGTIGTPVINPATNTIYVVAQTWDATTSTSTHKLHALDLSTGAEHAGSPVVIQANGFNSKPELQRPGLLFANNNIYIAFGSHCDQGTYKGFLFAYNATSLAQVGVFNAAPTTNGNAFWEAGTGSTSDSAGNIYNVAGNGTFDGVTNFSETLLKSSANLSLLDWGTPSNFSQLDAADQDFSSSGAVYVPGKNLVLAGGKDGVLRVFNAADLGHLGNNLQNIQATSSHIHSIAYFNNNVIIWGQSDFAKIFPFTGSTLASAPVFTGTTEAIGHPGGSLSVSANGVSNAILWASTNTGAGPDGQGAWHASVAGILHAYSLSSTSMSEIWNSQLNVARDSCNFYAKFNAPTVANGMVYLASFGTAQTKTGQVCFYGLLPNPPSANLIPDGTYYVQSVQSNLVLDIPGLSTAPGKVVQQYTQNNGKNQQWKLKNLGSNVVSLTNVSSNLVLDVVGASKANSALVDQATSVANQISQQWTVTTTGSGSFVLTNKNSGLALDVDGGGVAVGERIDQYPYNNQTWQQWRFLPLSAGAVQK